MTLKKTSSCFLSLSLSLSLYNFLLTFVVRALMVFDTFAATDSLWEEGGHAQDTRQNHRPEPSPGTRD